MRRGIAIALGALLPIVVGLVMLVPRIARNDSLESQARDLAGTIARQELRSVDITCRVERDDHALPTLECSCEIQVATEGPEVALLLNPGLRESNLKVNGQPAPSQRRGDVLRIVAPQREFQVTFQYAGRLRQSGLTAPWTDGSSFAAPHTTFWHPLDLHSFFNFHARLELPEGLTAVTAVETNTEQREGRHIVSWHETRPVIGAALVAGPFHRHVRFHGGSRYAVFIPNTYTGPSVESLLEALGQTHNMLEATLGNDGFGRVAVAVCGNDVAFANQTLANAVFALPEKALDDPAQAVAPMLATIWWGGTVTSRWFANRFDGDAWLPSGLAQYSAWHALARLYGAGRVPPIKKFDAKSLRISQPLRTRSPLAHAGYETGAYPYIASALAAYIGTDTMQAALRQIVDTHRYGAVTLSEATAVFARVSERDLDEFMRVWFDRPGHFDYELAELVHEIDTVRLRVVNRGSNPAFGPLTVVVETRDDTVRHEISVGARGGTVSLPSPHPIMRVVLDPDWIYPDTDRTNNVWPREG